jgi:hypothetical protein
VFTNETPRVIGRNVKIPLRRGHEAVAKLIFHEP